jgi:transposase-like protein
MGYSSVMKKYSDEFKNSIIARMLPPHNEKVVDLARETGVPKDTLYTWHARLSRHTENAGNSGGDAGLSSEEKFAIVLETAAMNEHELSVYCREKGLYPQQIRTWRKQCQQANEPGSNRVDKKKFQKQSKQIKELEILMDHGIACSG